MILNQFDHLRESIERVTWYWSVFNPAVLWGWREGGNPCGVVAL